MSAGRSAVLLVGLVLAGATADRASAQPWVVDLGAGVTTHEGLAADVGTRSAMLGVRREGAVWGYLTGGIPLDGEAVPWGAAGIGGRPLLLSGAFDIGIDLAGHGHLYRLPRVSEGADASGGSGATAHALPFIGWSGSGGGAEVHAGGVAVTQSVDGGSALDSAGRALAELGATAWVYASPELALTGETRYLRDGDGSYPYLGGRATYAPPAGVRVWAELGRWDLGADGSTRWGAGAELEVVPSLHLSASFVEEGTEPLYWNLPWRGWSVGVSRRFGVARESPPSLPLLPVPARADGRVRITLPVEAATAAPSVTGDFSGWNPVAMTRDGDEWVALLPLEPGIYHYVFLAADGTWFIPPWVATVDDGMGGESAVLVVP